MTYGIEIKNRNERRLIGEMQMPIERVAYGTAKVRVHKAGAAGSSSNYTGQQESNVGESLISFPSGTDNTNALIFARPEFNEAYGPKEETMALSYWPLAVLIFDTYFYFISPDENIDYYDGNRGGFTLPISNPADMYLPYRYENYFTEKFQGLGDPAGGQPVCKVYYEVWRVDAPPSVPQLSHGVQFRRPFGGGYDEIFSSNRRQFNADIVALSEDTNTATPFKSIQEGVWTVDDTNLPVVDADLPSLSVKANGEYLALMNVTAGLSAIARGGDYDYSESFEAPKAPYTAYFKRFIEWHYSGAVKAGRPFVRLVSRLAYTRETEDNSFFPDLRYNNDLGETPALVIGRTS